MTAYIFCTVDYHEGNGIGESPPPLCQEFHFDLDSAVLLAYSSKLVALPPTLPPHIIRGERGYLRRPSCCGQVRSERRSCWARFKESSEEGGIPGIGVRDYDELDGMCSVCGTRRAGAVTRAGR